MSDQDDQELMLRYLQGDPLSFEELYQRHQRRVYSYIAKRLAQNEDRDEVFQNTWIKFHRSRQLYRPATPVLPWIFVICRSELIDYLRKTKEHVPWHEYLSPLINEDQEQQEKINLDACDFLKEVEKEAIELRFYQDVDYLTLAKALHIKESNARKIISRGVKKLRTYLLSREEM